MVASIINAVAIKGVQRRLILLLLSVAAASSGALLAAPSHAKFDSVANPTRGNERERIIVRVGGKDIYGSGIIIRKLRDNMLVIATAAHVITDKRQTACVSFYDGVTVPAKVIRPAPSRRADVAFLVAQTSHSNAYSEAQLIFDTGQASGLSVIAAGYPADAPYTETKGRLSGLLPKPLAGEYQLTYTNDIQKGMSGGGIFTENNDLVGMNAVHSSPLWSAPVYYNDGTQVAPREAIDLENFSLGISSSTLKKELGQIGHSQYKLAKLGSSLNHQHLCSHFKKRALATSRHANWSEPPQPEFLAIER